MARKNHKKKNTKPPLHNRLWHKFVNLPRLVQLPFFLLVLTFPFVAYGVNVQIEKNKFKRYSKTSQALTHEIIQALGTGELSKREFCDRTNLKYEKGGLTCYHGRKIVFRNLNADEAKALLSISNSTLKKYHWIINKPSNGKILISAHPSGMPCTFGLVKETEQNFTIGVNCSDSARSEYYLVE